MNNYKILDQYYTNPKICDLIIRKIFSFFPNVKNSCFLEPSAGSGNFVNSLIKMNISKKNIIALDIEPFENPSILKFDYLNYKPNVLMDKLVIIGNPPFGKRGKLALSFLNKALVSHRIRF